MQIYNSSPNLVEKLNYLDNETRLKHCIPDNITTLHNFVLDHNEGYILLVEWFFEQAVNFIPIRLEGTVMKNGFYSVSLVGNLPWSHAWVHGNCIILSWQEAQSNFTKLYPSSRKGNNL